MFLSLFSFLACVLVVTRCNGTRSGFSSASGQFRIYGLTKGLLSMIFRSLLCPLLDASRQLSAIYSPCLLCSRLLSHTHTHPSSTRVGYNLLAGVANGMPNSVYCVISGGLKSICCLRPNGVHCVYFVRQTPKAASAQAWNRLSDDCGLSDRNFIPGECHMQTCTWQRRRRIESRRC